MRLTIIIVTEEAEEMTEVVETEGIEVLIEGVITGEGMIEEIGEMIGGIGEAVEEGITTIGRGIRISIGIRVKAVQVSKELHIRSRKWREKRELLNKDKDLRDNSET